MMRFGVALWLESQYTCTGVENETFGDFEEGGKFFFAVEETIFIFEGVWEMDFLWKLEFAIFEGKGSESLLL